MLDQNDVQIERLLAYTTDMAKKKKTNDLQEGEVKAKCELCERTKPLTKHHLIPRAVHGKKRFIKRFGKEEMQKRGLMCCRKCHSGIHDLIPKEIDLAELYNTKELLLAHPAIVKHVAWVKKQK